MTKSGLSTFNEGLTDRVDSKGRFIRIDNVVIDDRGDVDIDVVFCHTDLGWDFDDLDFDIYVLQFLAQSDIQR